jgi:hypothetical protein
MRCQVREYILNKTAIGSGIRKQFQEGYHKDDPPASRNASIRSHITPRVSGAPLYVSWHLFPTPVGLEAQTNWAK